MLLYGCAVTVSFSFDLPTKTHNVELSYKKLFLAFTDNEEETLRDDSPEVFENRYFLPLTASIVSSDLSI